MRAVPLLLIKIKIHFAEKYERMAARQVGALSLPSNGTNSILVEREK